MPFYLRNSRHIFSILLFLAFSKVTMEDKKYFTLKLNRLQFETIRNLFTHYDWDFDECIVGEKKTFGSELNTEQQVENGLQNVHEINASTSNSLPQSSDQPGNNNDGNGDDNGDDGGDSDSGDAETGCSFCFLSPCVVTHRQSWLPDQPALPHARNSELRKQKYRKFWKLMDLNGGWRHDKYIRKKQRLLEVDNMETVWVVREIMPKCILDIVRRIYPNVAGQPYMGHKWW